MLLAILVLGTALAGPSAQSAPEPFDLVVYGGTSAGVVAAVQGARSGLRVVLIEPSQHLGGLSASGLGATDIGNKQVIGGLAREFYREIKRHYASDAAWTSEKRSAFQGRGHTADDEAAWTFEPHVAEAVFEHWTREASVQVRRGERLDLANAVTIEAGRIATLRLEGGQTIAGRIFVDATYEGDLMAKAGVPYAVGREANAKYGESLNGVQANHAVHHQFAVPVDPYVKPGDPASGLLPGVQTDRGAGPGEEGSGDRRVQAYCFRICATDAASNLVPWPKPEDYDELDFELLLRSFDAGERQIPWHPVLMPNRKTDSNNNKGVSTDYVGMNHAYPDAGYAERAAIVAAHRRYTQGLLWTLANHARVPEAVRSHFQTWGLAADEFTDNGNWPYQIYVREARRMVGALVMTEHHCRGTEVATDPVGMGAYNMDSHHVQRYVDAQGHVRNEGDVQVAVTPYGISYRALVPPPGSVRNLLVPVCLSASHIAFGSIRMEPVFMVLGQSAALAAALALEGDHAVQDVPYAELRRRLLALGQVLEHAAAPGKGVDVGTLQGLVVDDTAAELTGAWVESGASSPFVGRGYRHDGDAGKGTARARFAFDLGETGDYEVQVAFTAHGNRSDATPVSVHAKVGIDTVRIDQRKPPPIDGLWLSLGVYRFGVDQRAVVEISNDGTRGHVIVDAVRLLPR